MKTNKIYRSIFLLFICFLVSFPSFAQYHYDFNERCEAAYKAMISLKIEEGNALVAQELKENPENLIPVFLANYSDFLKLLMNGSASDYKLLKPNMDKRLTILDKGNPSDPWYLYCKAGIYFQWASVRLRFNEYFSGGTEFRKSYLYLKDNQKKFPDFKYNQVLLGLEESIVGTIPDNYKWISNMLGMRGNLTNGISKITHFLNDKSPDARHLREEAIFYYCYLKYYLLSAKEETFQYINNSDLDTKNNLLFSFMVSNLSLDDNKSDIAEQILRNRNQSSGYLKAPIFDYQLGVVLLQKMDDQAIIYLKQFANNYKGRFYEKSAYQKMSFYYLVKGDIAQAKIYKAKILNIGSTEIDVDKQAQRYAKLPGLPNVSLLKANLSGSGGYFNKAINELNKIKVSELSGIDEMTEYYYRYGHVYALMGKPKNAIPYFVNALNLGTNSKGQFAARAALELALLYEDQGQKTKAIEYFKKCLAMKNHDFQSSIDQKAKAGLSRN